MQRPKNIKPMDREYWDYVDSGSDLPMFLWAEVQSGKITDEQAHAEQRKMATARYTVTLGDGTALSVVSANATTAHDDVARCMGIQPTASGAYVMFMRMRFADEWTKREIGLAIKQSSKS